MIEWESTTDGIRLVDAVGNDLTVECSTRNEPVADSPSPATEAELAVETDHLSIPGPSFDVTTIATGTTTTAADGSHHAASTGDTRLTDGTYLVHVPGTIPLSLRFEGPASITVDRTGQRIDVSLDAPRPVHLGFSGSIRAPSRAVTVPRTVDGVATALTHLSAAHRTTTPDRSLPRLRSHPPTIRFGDDVDVPSSVHEATPETGIELVAPESLATLFIAAPLAYYLGATVTVEPDADLRLLAPDAGVDCDLGSNPVEELPALLARTFWLDCLVRDGGPNASPDLVERDLLDRIAIDPAATYAASPADRLATYIDAPFETIADDLPEWPLAMHVAPTMAHVSTLPFLLDHLSLVYPPETETLEGAELVERSLDDFYRGTPGPIASVEMLKPKLRDGRVHGWLAPGTPIDVFKTIPEAYENGLDTVDDRHGEMSVVVVLNDRDMTGEHERVAAIYEERAASTGIDVTLLEELTCDELAAVFQEPHEFLHYIGHCEVDGLRCADGNLSIDDLPGTAVQTFFLNACGSYYEGLDLVRQGAIAGAVTFRKVLDEQAAKVGTAFAHLLMSGFPIESGLRLARRRIMMGKDYAVVGDGMRTLSTSNGRGAGVAYVDTLASGDLAVSWDVVPTGDHGDTYRVDAGGGQRPRLSGNRSEFTLDRESFASFVRGADVPIILDGEFVWSHELVARFGDAD